MAVVSQELVKGVAQQLKNGVRLLWGRIMQKIVDDGNSAGRVLDLDSQSCGVFDSQAIFSQAQRAKNASSWFTLSWMVFTPLKSASGATPNGQETSSSLAQRTITVLKR